MTVETTLAVTEQDIRAYSEKMQEPGWMTDFRLTALAQAADLPMPEPDKTNIKSWDFLSFSAHTVESEGYSSLTDLPQEIQALIDTENQKTLYIQRNNTPAYVSVSQELQDKGVIVTDIHTAIREHGNLVKQYLMTDVVKPDEHKLTAYHAALLNGGAFIYIPKNVEMDEVVQVIYVQDDESVSLFNHTLLVAETNSKLTYVENYLSTFETATGQANIVSEVLAKDNAKITYGAVDVLAKGYTAYVNRRGVAHRDAVIEWALGLMNDSNTIVENVTHLVGDNSEGHVKTVVVGRGDQKQNFTTKVIHWGKNSEGQILKHGVMKDSASSIFNGIGKIEHGASKSNAEQESRVLMLSEKARGDANPILLIDEDDVTAGHAASVGRVDPLQMYYLMSRGISKHEAERLIIHGFLAPVVRALPVEGVKKQLTEVIERKVR